MWYEGYEDIKTTGVWYEGYEDIKTIQLQAVQYTRVPIIDFHFLPLFQVSDLEEVSHIPIPEDVKEC